MTGRRTDGQDPRDRLVRGLIEWRCSRRASGRPVTVTWLNHYSAPVALSAAADCVRAMDVCGVDGQLLKLLIGHPGRTSADLVVPELLAQDREITRVLAIGGGGDLTAPLTSRLQELAGRELELEHIDGYANLVRGRELHDRVRAARPDLVLVGLGAGLQDEVAVEVADALCGGYVLTCGGFLDQVLTPAYYPRWAYPLRLNWLVRLAREPRRLWRRYSIDAARALLRAPTLRSNLASVDGLTAHRDLVSHG